MVALWQMNGGSMVDDGGSMVDALWQMNGGSMVDEWWLYGGMNADEWQMNGGSMVDEWYEWQMNGPYGR